MKQPNIILILCDDLGYGDVGCYGSLANRTPRLDRIAAEGMRLTDFHVASPVCSPSRAALMTGCYPKRIGLDSGHEFCVLLPGDPIGLHPDEVTFATLLKSAGYATKMIGKWHLGDQPPFLPTHHGFDSYFGLPYSNDMLPEYFLCDRHHFPPLPLMRDDEVMEVDPNQASLTDRYAAEADRFVRRCAGVGQPFLLYLAHMYVHVPIHAPMKYLVQSLNGPYGAAVEHVDFITGFLLDTLAELHIDSDTLVVFTSDNGSECRQGGSNGPLRGTKGTTWEGGMREPCIIHWPGTVPGGTVCAQPVTAMDLLPTFAALAGVEPPPDRTIDGADIASLLVGESCEFLADRPFFYYGTGNHTLEAVRAGRWKLHLCRDELYDLESDLGEKRNIIAGHPEIVSALTRIADGCRADLGDAAAGIAGGGCRNAGRVADPKTLTRLEQMDPIIRALYDLDDTIQGA